MTTTAPYNIAISNGHDAQDFYSVLEDIASDCINNIPKKLLSGKSYSSDLLAWQSANAISENDAIAELLMIGVYWKQYKDYIGGLDVTVQSVNKYLFQLRKKSSWLKLVTDQLRGIILSVYLLKPKSAEELPRAQRLRKLCVWLDSTKEFRQEVACIEKWRTFIEQLSIRKQVDFWQILGQITNWFESYTLQNLGVYTHNVDEFSKKTKNYYRFREDRLFAGKPAVEYHLNMVVAELMNRSLHEGFAGAEKQVVIVPTCMSARGNCRAIQNGNHLECVECNASCNVFALKKHLKITGHTLILIPHSTGFSKFLKPWAGQKHTALIGVACVLNLIQGGYEMRKLNIPSQCVFLNSCSCKQHWISGKPTQLDIEQLDKLLYAEKPQEKEPVVEYEMSV